MTKPIPVEPAAGPDRLPLEPDTALADPVDYYVEAPRDGVAASCRIDGATKSRIAEVVQSGRTRYKTESDVLRAAVHWFLVEKVGPWMDSGRFLADLRIQAFAIRRAQTEARIQDAARFVREVSSSLMALMLNDAVEQAAQVWTEAMDTLRVSDEPFRSRAEMALRRDPKLQAVRDAAERSVHDDA